MRREIEWEVLRGLVDDKEKAETTMKKLDSGEAEIKIVTVDFEFYLSDILSEEENKAILTIVDTILGAEVERCKRRIPEVEKDLEREETTWRT